MNVDTMMSPDLARSEQFMQTLAIQRAQHEQMQQQQHQAQLAQSAAAAAALQHPLIPPSSSILTPFLVWLQTPLRSSASSISGAARRSSSASSPTRSTESEKRTTPERNKRDTPYHRRSWCSCMPSLRKILKTSAEAHIASSGS